MPSRDGLLDKPMLAACGEVCDLTILDQWMRRGPLLQDPSRAQRAGGWGLKLANRWLTPRSLRMSSKPDAVADVVAAV